MVLDNFVFLYSIQSWKQKIKMCENAQKFMFHLIIFIQVWVAAADASAWTPSPCQTQRRLGRGAANRYVTQKILWFDKCAKICKILHQKEVQRGQRRGDPVSRTRRCWHQLRVSFWAILTDIDAVFSSLVSSWRICAKVCWVAEWQQQLGETVWRRGDTAERRLGPWWPSPGEGVKSKPGQR